MPDRESEPTEESVESIDMDVNSGPALMRTGGKKKGRKFDRKKTKVV